MEKIILLIILSLISLRSYAPLRVEFNSTTTNKLNNYYTIKEINANINSLKQGDIKTRSQVYKLIQPILKVYLKEYECNYIISDSLSYAISCIFLTESSNSKGQSAKSSLWLKYNNPFGMTTNNTGNTVTLMSWEKVNGKRVNTYRIFKTYNSLEEAVESLMQDYLLNKRYSNLRLQPTVKDFLYGLYDCGYMTNREAATFWYQSYLKYK